VRSPGPELWWPTLQLRSRSFLPHLILLLSSSLSLGKTLIQWPEMNYGQFMQYLFIEYLFVMGPEKNLKKE
jgi:hypothetical protein